MFVEHQPGSFVSGKRFDDYHHKGQPYLDGYKAIAAPKMAVRLNAIRGDRAAIEFRGFPPKARDDLVNALGDKITVQESDWNCNLMFTPNQQRAPFDDVRVRQALTLSVDRWGGSKYLSKIAIVKTVGGVVFPNHPLAATEAELKKMAISGTRNESSSISTCVERVARRFRLHGTCRGSAQGCRGLPRSNRSCQRMVGDGESHWLDS